MPYLQSSALENVTYDETAHRLCARFRGNGQVMVYEDVPQDVYDSLIFAESVGAFFHDHIHGHYPAHKP